MDCQAAAEDVVIVAPRLPDAPGEATYSRFDIDAETIENALRLDEALVSAPGVSLFRRNDSSVANATIQGLSVRAIAPSGAGRALVTLDGAPLNDPFGGWVIWGALPTETIAGARVLRGAGAGPYGAGALTGSVALTERRGQGAAFTVEGGERGQRRASGVGEAGDDALSLMLAATVQENDGWIPVREGRGAADEALWSESAAGVARVTWRGDNLVLAARLGAYGEARGAGLAGANSSTDGESLSLTLADPVGAFAWRVQAWALRTDMANSFVAVAADRSSASPANDQVATPALGWGANAALRWTRARGGVEIGADLRNADGETQERFAFSGDAPTRAREAGGRTFTAGAYVEGWRETGAWLFTGGARIDLTRAEDGRRIERLIATDTITLDVRPEDTETAAPTARLGVRRALGEYFVRGAAYAGFRPPTLNELHRPFRVGNDVTEANPLLEPERLHGADLAVGGSHADWAWSAGLFYASLEDAIVNVTLGMGPGTFPPGVFVPAGGAYRQRQNAGRIAAIGVEAEANGALGDALVWRAALTYTDASFVSGALDGFRPAQAPEWSVSAGLDWRALPATTLSAALSYESDRFEDDINARVLSGAAMLDLRLEQALGHGVSVYAALDNALDVAIETGESGDGVESFAAPQALRLGVRVRTGEHR